MEAIWWPLAIVVIVVMLLLTQRKSIARFIDRTKEVTRTGIRAAETQPQRPADAKAQSVDELMKAFDSPLLREGEKGIEQHLTTSGVVHRQNQGFNPTSSRYSAGPYLQRDRQIYLG